jgi:hypothetical protein
MRAATSRILVILVCLAFGLGLLGSSSRAAAADSNKKKSWPSKKHHKATHHKATTKPAAKAGGTAAPAEEAEDDEGDDSSESEDKPEDKPKPKAKTADKKADDKKADDDDKNDEREASSAKGGDDDDEGETSVVRRKAKRPVMEEAGGTAPVALELSAGPRVVHRSFDFNDSLTKPYAYALGAAPAPFLDLGLYPAAFATRGAAASFGLIARYEKIVATKTTDVNGATFDTLGQQIELGVRGRLPLGDHELGLTASGGQHTFHVTAKDMGPSGGTSVPNVDYTFAGLDADVRLRPTSQSEIGAHVGTRFVMKTGDLAKEWFNTTKTTSIEAGVSVAYKLTPMFSVVGGADFLRYAFDFNPVNPQSQFVAGGAVDQYISGFLALRLTVSGG